MRSVEWEVWNGKCEAWSGKCEVWNGTCEAWGGECEAWSGKCEAWNAPLPTSRFRSAAPPPFGQTVTFLQKLVDDGVKAALSSCQSTAFASSKLPFRPLKGQRLERQRTTLRTQRPINHALSACRELSKTCAMPPQKNVSTPKDAIRKRI